MEFYLKNDGPSLKAVVKHRNAIFACLFFKRLSYCLETRIEKGQIKELQSSQKMLAWIRVVAIKSEKNGQFWDVFFFEVELDRIVGEESEESKMTGCT